MKVFKITLPLVAFVLAVATSAFTNKPESKDSSLTTELHYFYVEQTSGGLVLGDWIGDFDPADQTAIRNASGCQDQTQVVCARGFVDEEPSSAEDDYLDEITKSNP